MPFGVTYTSRMRPFAPDGTFHPLPTVAVESFRAIFAQKVLGLLLERGMIGADVVENIRSWKHSGFGVDKSVRIEAGGRPGLERLLRYIVSCPFRIERVIKLGLCDSVIYVPDEEDEAVRDLVRARDRAMVDQRKARQRLKGFLL
jgi:Putative transposase